jgi:hypothetical protein
MASVYDFAGNGKGGLFGYGGGSTGTALSDAGGAVSDLFGAFGDFEKSGSYDLKAQGDALQAKNYGLAADLAGQNEKFTETSTAIKLAQINRSNTMQIGQTTADVAGAGFANSGSALDILRDSAGQGALTKAVAGQQGLITEAGYHEQEESFTNMQQAAILAEQEDKNAASAANFAGVGSAISGVFKAGATLAVLA